MIEKEIEKTEEAFIAKIKETDEEGRVLHQSQFTVTKDGASFLKS